MTRILLPLVALLAALLAAPLRAQPAARIDEVLQVHSSKHFDQFFRKRGFESHRAGRHDAAMRYFKMAASYADKTAQLAVATMYLNGEGVAPDPALAYAWADLAAERGYPKFIAERERIWARLGAAEQRRALELGSAIYAEYGDAAAKPRMEFQLGLLKKSMTGSRAGFEGNLRVSNYAGCRGVTTGGATVGQGCFVPDYWAPRNWHPEAYWKEQDALWMPRGEVDIGPLRRPPASRIKPE